MTCLRQRPSWARAISLEHAGHPRCPPDPGRGLRRYRGHGGRDRSPAHRRGSTHHPGSDHPAVPSGGPRRPGQSTTGPAAGWICPRADNTWILNGLLTPPPVKHWPRRSTCTPHPPARMTPAARVAPRRRPGRDRRAPLIPPDRPTGTRACHDHRDPDQLDTGLGVRWPSGLLMSRVEVAEHPCTAKVSWSWAPPPIRSTGSPGGRIRATVCHEGSACRAGRARRQAASIPAVSCRRIAASLTTSGPGSPAGPPICRNLVLVCRYHRRIHHGHLHITQTPPAPSTHHRPFTGHRIEPGVRAPGENEDRKPL